MTRQDPNAVVMNNDEVMTTPTPVTENINDDEGTSEVSSSYSDVVFDVGSHTVTVKGNARIEAVESNIEALDRIFTCTICGYMSQEKVNIVAYIAYIHKSQPCDTCGSDCFNSCRPWNRPKEHQEPQPTSTQPPPIVLTTWSNLLGTFTPADAATPAVDYKVTWHKGRFCGKWYCTWCGIADEDINVVTRHIESEHTPGALIRCKYFSASYRNIQELDQHYVVMHSNTIPVPCPDCPAICHNRAN